MDANLSRMVDALMDSEDVDEINGDENFTPFKFGKMYKGIREDEALTPNFMQNKTKEKL